MKTDKTLVLYYSRTGSNEYLAERIAADLNADIEKIRPKAGSFFMLIVYSLLNFSFGLKEINHTIENYKNLILVGPIWMGQIISPIRDAMKKYGGSVKNIHFATCCGSTEKDKDSKYGYESVFEKARTLLLPNKVHCTAFPIVLALPEDKREDGDLIMKTRLNDSNFTGELMDKYESFKSKII
jgi:flavodoxin